MIRSWEIQTRLHGAVQVEPPTLPRLSVLTAEMVKATNRAGCCLRVGLVVGFKVITSVDPLGIRITENTQNPRGSTSARAGI